MFFTANTMRYIYLGSLLKGGSLEEQRFQRLTNELDLLYISYSFPAKIVGDIIEKPSLQSQRTSLSKIMNQEGMTGKQIVSFIYDMNQFTYYNELKLAFNCNIDVASVFKRHPSAGKSKSTVKFFCINLATNPHFFLIFPCATLVDMLKTIMNYQMLVHTILFI